MGKLDSTAFWCYRESHSNHFILSSYLPLSERIVMANNLKKQQHRFEVLVRNAAEENKLDAQFPVRQINHGLIAHIKLFFSNLFNKKILISTGYYNKLDILFIRRAYYDGQNLIKKPLSVSIFLTLY